MNPKRFADRACLGRGVRVFQGVAAILLLASGDGRPSLAAAVASGKSVAPALSTAQTVASSHLASLRVADAPTGSLLVQIELGLSFVPSKSWTLQHNGPPVIYEVADLDPATGQSRNVRFELRYRSGYFTLTALDDNDIGAHSLPFGVDIYPSNISPVSPEQPCDAGFNPCYNGYGFFSTLDWPKQAGKSLSLAIPHPGPGAPPAARSMSPGSGTALSKSFID